MNRETAIKTILLDYDVELQEITPETRLSDLGLDSLDIVEITMNIEKEFDIMISDPEVESWKSLQDIYNTLDQKLGIEST